MAHDYEVVVVGAGVVGLAVARQLARWHHSSLLVLERHERFGQETSSRNSEVVHAGLYYDPGSLKAQLCVRGGALLYALCEQYRLPCRRLGKLVVAAGDEDEERLQRLLEVAHRNGALEVRLLSSREVKKLEPSVKATCALWSPATGIVDAHSLMRFCATVAREADASFAYRAELTGAARVGEGYRLTVRDAGGELTQLTTRIVVNAAGLDADTVAGLFGLDLDAVGYRQHYVKGYYFSYAGPRLDVSHLVYPAPGAPAAGLGIHLTLDLGGQVRFGPDAHYLEERRQDYAFDPTLRPLFGAALRRYLPELRDEHLAEGYAGIRPRLYRQGEAARDFVIRHEADRGLPGLVNLVGIESPGLTAALAIAERVEELVAVVR